MTIIAEVNRFIKNQEFDTDAIEMDAEDDEQANISMINEKYYASLKSYMYYTKCMLYLCYSLTCFNNDRVITHVEIYM